MGVCLCVCLQCVSLCVCKKIVGVCAEMWRWKDGGRYCKQQQKEAMFHVLFLKLIIRLCSPTNPQPVSPAVLKTFLRNELEYM